MKIDLWDIVAALIGALAATAVAFLHFGDKILNDLERINHGTPLHPRKVKVKKNPTKTTKKPADKKSGKKK